MFEKGSWGILIFILGCALLIVGFFLPEFLGEGETAIFVGRLLIYSGITAGILVPILSYLSYPRVHNLKVLLSGVLTGVAVIAFFLLGPKGLLAIQNIQELSNFITGLYLFMIVALFISTLLPTFLKYRTTKYITVTMLILELVVIYLLRSELMHLFKFSAFRGVFPLQWIKLIPAGMTFLAFLISIFILKPKFHLGGILGGTGLLFCGGWYLGPLSANVEVFDTYIFSVSVLFLGFGVIVHWLARMGHRAEYDPLLLIYNRGYCEKVLSEQIRINTSPPFGIAIIDVDRFKKINDKYGHKIGDEVLIRVARILKNQLVPDGIVCRYGGDEFVVFFPGKDSKRTKRIMDKIRKKVKTSVTYSMRKKIEITLSVGISHRETGSQDLSVVLKSADRALYRSKKHGRDQVRFRRL
jgi:diguanylate cyclase (GGDEF)-like protein